MSNDPRILELLDFAAMHGFVLPRPAEEILALEDAGHGVDLASGDILWNLARERVTLTVIGEATAVVYTLEDGEVRP